MFFERGGVGVCCVVEKWLTLVDWGDSGFLSLGWFLGVWDGGDYRLGDV